MCTTEIVDRFQFQHDSLFNNDVESMCSHNTFVPKENSDFFFGFRTNPLCREFQDQGIVVNTSDKARPQNLMNGNHAFNDSRRQFIPSSNRFRFHLNHSSISLIPISPSSMLDWIKQVVTLKNESPWSFPHGLL